VPLGRLPPFVLARLGDAQLEIFDDGVCIGDLSLGDGGECLGLELSCTSDDDGVTLGDQQRFQRFDIIGKGLDAGVHRSSFYSRKPPICRGIWCRNTRKTGRSSPPVRA
jgi:hypothetical protein